VYDLSGQYAHSSKVSARPSGANPQDPQVSVLLRYGLSVSHLEADDCVGVLDRDRLGPPG